MATQLQTFATPDPIELELSVEYGSARIIAGNRETTVVDVRPTNPSRKSDLEAVEKTRVDFAAGRLEVRTPKPRHLGLLGKPGSVEIVIQAPAGSHVQGSGGYGDFDTQGRLGNCFFKTSYGTLRVEEAAALTLHTAGGDISAGRVAGAAEITSSAGDIRVGETLGEASLKTSAGDIRVERTGAGLSARTAYGSVKVAHARSGRLELTTSYGDVEVGVEEGAAVFLEVTSKHGAVRNELVATGEAPPSDGFLGIRASTGFGDIRIYRA